MNLVDPEGRKIYFAKGVPEWFKERFAATIQYMNEKGTSWIFKKLQDSDNVYYIDYTECKTKEEWIRYNPKNKTIYWNPNIFIESSNGIFIFPTTILAHEGAHALQDEKYDNKKWNELRNTFVAEYDNLLEKEVITTTEQEIAKKHGDINNNDITREDHKGEIKILTSKDYVSIFGSDTPQNVNDENNYLILIYLYNTWKKLKH